LKQQSQLKTGSGNRRSFAVGSLFDLISLVDKVFDEGFSVMHYINALPPNPLVASHKGKRKTIFRIPPKPLAMPGRRFFVVGYPSWRRRARAISESFARYPANGMPLRIKRTRQTGNLEFCSDSIERPSRDQSNDARPLADANAT
jgi:hypothetical protein